MQTSQNLAPDHWVSPPFGGLTDSAGWIAASLELCVPVAVVAVVAMAFIRVR